MTRERLEELLSAQLDGQLSAAETDELAAELEGSPEARALQAAMAGDRALFAALPQHPAPPALRARIQAQAHQPPHWAGLVRRGLGLAAALAVAFWLWPKGPPRATLYQVAGAPNVLESRVLQGHFLGGESRLIVSIDAGTTRCEPQLKVSYDFNGDGQWDRTEFYPAVALDDQEGWQEFRLAPSGSVEEMRDMENGRIRLEVVSDRPLNLNPVHTYLRLPYDRFSEGKAQAG